MDTYEKKYKNALTIAKSRFKVEKDESVLTCLGMMFPELRESEDERMIREFNDWLCEEIEWRTNDVRDEKDRRTLNMLCYVLTKVKDWLERQKETLHISESCKENADSFTSEDERINRAIFKALSKKDARDVLLAEGVQVSEALSYLEKQKEQKPTEWKLPDDFEEAVYKVANFISPFNSQEELRKVSHRFAEQLLDMAKKEVSKPAEWSEKDEKFFELLHAALYQIKVRIGKDEYDRAVARLKSLRPSWKPSEEQMTALDGCLEHWSGNKSQKEIIESLYEQLKKLM